MNAHFAIIGHVDHGKSTLVGRLIYETGNLKDGKMEAIQAMCKRRGMPFEWAFVMDGLKAERDQGITIDTAHIPLKIGEDTHTIIDAPGHREFIKNMITGAANADAALLLIDASEGIQEQSKRHAALAQLLNIKQLIVIVNKMDLVDYSAAVYERLCADYRAYLSTLNLEARAIIPISARSGENLKDLAPSMPWYDGPTVVQAMLACSARRSLINLPLRFPVQDVYKLDHRRIIAGRIESGRLRVGDTIVISPTGKTTQIKSIEAFPEPHAPILAAKAGQSVAVTLNEQLFVERGQVIAHPEHAPFETNVFRARLFWLGNHPARVGAIYKLKVHTHALPARIEAIERVVDMGNLSEQSTTEIPRHAIADVIIRSHAKIALDDFRSHDTMGRFVLVDGYDIAGGGVISTEGFPNQRSHDLHNPYLTPVEHKVELPHREAQNSHRAGILFFTGLSGSGKTTLSLALEKALFQKGYRVYVLDGDNIRRHLSSDLGFSPDDRQENLRRVAEVSRLFAEAGMLVITAFIAPYLTDRARVREIAGSLPFHEVYIKADLATCEARDPKGLYKKARSGEIPEFTGISAPYEAPPSPDFIIDTEVLSPEESLEILVRYVDEHFALDTKVWGYSI